MSTEKPGPVVVGIDGSLASIHAAEWAVDEAIRRNVPLCLVHVTRIAVSPKSFADEYRMDDEYAEVALRTVVADIKATEKPVKVEAVIVRGLASDALVAESRHASLVCVGSTGVGRVARAFLGSTAAEVAERAHCPVAILRPPAPATSSRPTWITMSYNIFHTDEKVVEQAMAEARLRKLPVLAVTPWQEDLGGPPYDELDRRITALREKHDGVRVYPVTTRAGMDRFLAECDEPVSLIVVGADDATDVLYSSAKHGLGERSILVVRN